MMLGNSPTNFNDRGFLECIGANNWRAHLASNAHDGAGIHFGICEGGDKISCAWSAGGHTNANFASGSSIAFSSKCATLFVPRKNGTKLIRDSGKSLVKGHASTAWVGENNIYAMID